MTLSFDPRARLKENRVYEADVNRGRKLASFHQGLPEKEPTPRSEAMRDATDLCGYFCLKNSLPLPATVQRNNIGLALGRCSSTGDKQTFLVEIALERLREGADPLDDKSIIGVLAHEIGHIAHQRLGITTRARADRIFKSEEPINAYETQHLVKNDYVEETMAETIRVFILDPVWLRDNRPRRWEMLSRSLQPIFDMPPAPPQPEDRMIGDGVKVTCWAGVIYLSIENLDMEIPLSQESLLKLDQYRDYVKEFKA